MSDSIIPPRLEVPANPPKKFLTCVSTSDYLKLQHEAAERGTDILSLAGAVLTHWVRSGCPDRPFESSHGEQ